MNLKQKYQYPSYLYNVINRVSSGNEDYMYYREKANYSGDVAKKYNQMVESLGSQAEDLDVFIYPPPLCTDSGFYDTTYNVPALGIDGWRSDCNERNDHLIKLQNDKCECLDNYRWLALPSTNLIRYIIRQIFEKLDGHFSEGINNKQDKITLPIIKKELSSAVKRRNEENDNYHEHVSICNVDRIFKKPPLWRPKSWQDEYNSPEVQARVREEGRRIEEWLKMREKADAHREEIEWERNHNLSGYSG